jgi:hypothetical protein
VPVCCWHLPNETFQRGITRRRTKPWQVLVPPALVYRAFFWAPPDSAVRPDVEKFPLLSPDDWAEQRGLAAKRKNLASESKTMDLSAVRKSVRRI